ncbi:MAG: hypothetical protein BIFFINMI_02082 [Phycisphaerae bacterium]|nr:hypothetical protein [Phycisphaerae bacterium]
MGLVGRLPQAVPGGGRDKTFDMFRTAHRTSHAGQFVALLVDSEVPVADNERPWAHLKGRDGWDRPTDVEDEQALLMVTCMETWIATDRATLRENFDQHLQESALPAVNGMESRTREAIQDALAHATRNCAAPYAKGRRSFEIVGKLNPQELRRHLPAFERIARVLNKKLRRS